MRGDTHAGFGGRVRETGRLKDRDRALARPYEKAVVLCVDLCRARDYAEVQGSSTVLR